MNLTLHATGRWRRILFTLVLLAASLPAASRAAKPAPWEVSPRIGRLPLGTQWVDVDLRIGVVTPGWDAVAYFDTAPDLRAERQDGSLVWRARPSTEPAGGCRIEQRVQRLGDDLILDISLAALGTQRLAGVYLMLNVQAPAFAGGSFRLDETRGELPLAPAAEPHLRIREATQCTLWNGALTEGVSLSAGDPIRLLVQDGRRWGPQFSILATLHEGAPPTDTPVVHRFVLSALGQRRPAEPATLRVDPRSRLGRFDGFGGNFCFELGNGVADYVQARLHPPLARIRMHLDDLAPPPPGSRDPHTDWLRMLIAADRPWSELWQNLNIADTLHRSRARIQISTWRVPAWMLDHPIRHDQNQIPRRHYETLAGMVAAYLDYLRQSRGIEPETFSFNEPDWGANVIFTPEEHRDALLAVAAAIDRHGLRTRLMIGDLATARGGADYLAPVLASPALMERAAGLAFHAWGEADDDAFADWRTLADRIGLPLSVGEIGVDTNWRDIQLHGYDYALRELARYFHVLNRARPQAVLYWEYGASYSLLPPHGAGGWIGDSERLAFQQHWVRLTPPGAEAIACHTRLPTLLTAAFAWPRGTGEAFTIHLGNFGPETRLEVAGLPAGLPRLRRFETRQGTFFRQGRSIDCSGGTGFVTLPAQSLTTLTTLDGVSAPTPVSPSDNRP